MTFRSKKRADRIRIAVLEDDLAERNHRIAELEAELQRARAPKRAVVPSSNTNLKRAPTAAVVDVPDTDVWHLVTRPFRWVELVVGLAPFCVIGIPLLVNGVSNQNVTSMAIGGLFIAMGGTFGIVTAAEQGLELDRRHQRIYKWYRFIGRIRRPIVVPSDGIVMVTSTVFRKNGPSWKRGVLRMGSHTLASGKEAEQDELAQRIAAFMSVAYTRTGPAAKEAGKHLRLLMVVMVVVTAAVGLVMALSR